METVFTIRGARFTKILSTVLLCSIVFQPVVIVYGQETAGVQSTPAVSVSTPVSAPTDTSVASPASASDVTPPPPDTPTTLSDTSAPALADTASPPPPPKNPLVYQKVTMPQADLVSGALSYAYPIKTPPGRSGVEPSLALVYNSSETSQINTLGYGWALNIPTIERVGKHGVAAIYTDRFFTSSVSGELASTTISNQYVARVDSGDFLKYVYLSDTLGWNVYDKHGTVYTYGGTRESRLGAPTYGIAKWFLTEVRDANGNYVSYNYTLDTLHEYDPRITSITYTNHQSDAGEIVNGIFSVSFVYDTTRADHDVQSYKWGIQVSNPVRIKGIEIRTNNILTHSYDLSYGVGVNGVRSVLSRVTETGYDVHGVGTTLPPTTFDYTNGFENLPVTGGIGQLVSGGTTSVAGGSYTLPRRGDVYADLNGDGYVDSFLLSPNGFNPSAFFNSYQSNTLGSTFTIMLPQVPFAQMYNGGSYAVDYGARAADFNGDGFVDIVGRELGYTESYCASNFCPPILMYASNAGTTTNNIGFSVGSPRSNASGGEKSFIADFTGTGLPSTHSKDDNIFTVVDINADGVDDKSGGQYITVNRGGILTDISSEVLIPIPVRQLDDYGNDLGFRYIDVNADGLPDVVRGYDFNDEAVHYHEVYINTGSGFILSNTLQAPKIVELSHGPVNVLFSYRVTDYFDTNGDGIVDIPNAPTTRADMLKTITYPTGGAASLQYKPTPHYRTPDGALANPKLPTIIWTVSKITTSDGTDNPPQTTNYFYENGRGYFNGADDRKFSGFEKVTKDIGTRTEVSYYHQGNGDNTTYGEVGDSYGKIGRLFKTEVFDRNGALLARTQNLYEETPIAGADIVPGIVPTAPVFVYQTKKIDETYDPTTATHRDHVVSYAYDTTNGNLTGSTDYGEVTSVSTAHTTSQTFTDIGRDVLYTSIYYATSTVTTLPQTHTEVWRTRTTNISGIPVGDLMYQFDDTGEDGLLTKGNITKTFKRPRSGGSIFITTRGYNDFGLLLFENNERGNTTSFQYDDFNLYPTRTTNALHQVTTSFYDYASGKVTRMVDPNGVATETTYDEFGRPIDEKIPDPTFLGQNVNAPLVVKTHMVYIDTPNAMSVMQTKYIDANTLNQSAVYADGLGRTMETRTKATDTVSCNDCYIVSDVIYDDNGRIAKQSLPYFSSGITKTPATNDTALYTTLVYDALDRPIQKIDALGTTNTLYNIWQTSITDTLGHRKTYSKDVFGRLVAVDEENEGAVYSTRYTYDDNGNLATLIDALGNMRTFFSNLLGWRLTAEDLHTPTDTTFGTYSYQYDPRGNLTLKTTPNGDTITYTYDELDRPLTENMTGVQITNAYDICTNGVGRLCSTTAGAVTTSYTYTPLGQVANETKVIGEKTFTTSYIYDIAGNTRTIVLPNSNKVSYSYATSGMLSTVSFTEGSTTPATVIANGFEYAPTGQLARVTYGSGTQTVNTYDAGSLYRLTNKKSLSQQGTLLQDLTYTYDAVGNIVSLVDASATNNKKIVSYSYDDLYRLKSAVASSTARGGDYAETFTYDPLGNLTYKSDVGMYHYEGNLGTSFANPHAVTNMTVGTTTTSFAYDASGNLISERGGRTADYTYDYAGHLLSVTRSGTGTPTTETYQYDHSGARMSRTGSDGTTLYPSKYYTARFTATSTPAGSSTSIFLGDTLIATRDMTPTKLTSNTGTCPIPQSGAVTLTTSCTVTGTVLAPGTVTIPSGVTMTITPTSSLLLDFKTSSLKVKKGAGLLIKKGATLRSLKPGDLTPSISTTYYLTDHLNSVTLGTDQTGNITSSFDYYPYGSLHASTGNTTGRRYIGQFQDPTSLDYLNARYYDSGRGQFISEDPVFWEVGQSDAGKGVLLNPQTQNSYSYANNNPIIYRDASGRCVDGVTTTLCIVAYTALASIVGGIVISAYGAYQGDVSLFAVGQGLQDIGVSGGAGLGQTQGFVNPVTAGKNKSASLKSEVGVGTQVPDIPVTLTAPESFRFSQDTVSANFQLDGTFKGVSRASVIEGIHNGSVDVKNLKIDYVLRDELKVIENNRSASVLIEAGVPVKNWNLNQVQEGSKSANRIDQHLTNSRLSSVGTKTVRSKK